MDHLCHIAFNASINGWGPKKRLDTLPKVLVCLVQ